MSYHFTEGYLNAHVRDVNCSGSEDSIFDCSYNQLTDYSCGQYDDASVICQRKFIIQYCRLTLADIVNDVQNSNCSSGDIRLTGGSNAYEGRVELCINGVWGSVCDSGWDDREAHAVCRQLGHRGNRTMLEDGLLCSSSSTY